MTKLRLDGQYCEKRESILSPLEYIIKIILMQFYSIFCVLFIIIETVLSSNP